MAAGAVQLFQGFKRRLGLGEFVFSTHTIGCALYTSTLIPDTGVQEVLADLAGEVAAVNGYTAGGVALSTVTWAEDGTSAVELNAANTVFTASGGSMVCRYAVLYNATPTAKPLVGYVLLDTTPADITITSGNSLILDWSDLDGIFRLP
jgi:hypothetical protein